jgi:cytochrome c-type biogenesis protein CcmE
VARKRSPARLVIALSVAAALAVFLVYTSIAGGGTTTVLPSELPGHTGKVQLVGTVVGPATGDPHGAGLRFRMRDVHGPTSVPVVYHGSVPDLFKPGRNVVVDGRMLDGTFTAVPDTLLTKCPSKYTATTTSS